MIICDVRHNWPKKAGYTVDRPNGRAHYIFVHYCSDVTLHCEDRIYELPADSCMMIAPHTPHKLYCSQDLIHNWLHLDPGAAELIAKYGIPLNKPFFPHNTTAIASMFRKMEAEFYSANPFREDLLDGYVKEFLIWLYRSVKDLPVTRSFSNSMLTKMTAARRTILSSSEKNWTLEEMAALIPFSPSRFHTLYKMLFGTTPAKDLIDMRISLAKSLLRSNQDMTLAETAEKLGYNDQYHFIRQFKAATGQTPGKYRKNK